MDWKRWKERKGEIRRWDGQGTKGGMEKKHIWRLGGGHNQHEMAPRRKDLKYPAVSKATWNTIKILFGFKLVFKTGIYSATIK